MMAGYSYEEAEVFRDIVQDFRAFSLLAGQAMDGSQQEQFAFIRLFYLLSDSTEARMAKAFPDQVKDGRVGI